MNGINSSSEIPKNLRADANQDKGAVTSELKVVLELIQTIIQALMTFL